MFIIYAREERLELPTPGFGDQCSTKLSYSRKRGSRRFLREPNYIFR